MDAKRSLLLMLKGLKVSEHLVTLEIEVFYLMCSSTWYWMRTEE
jgi:hypothetical protein